MARQVITKVRQRVSKYKTGGINPVCRSLLVQILLGMLAIATRPQDAPRDFLKQPHPHVKHKRRDLRSVVKAAEHDTLRGQGELFPRWRARCDHAFPVVHLKTIRQMELSTRPMSIRLRPPGQAQQPQRLHLKAGYMAAPELFVETSDSFPSRGRRPYLADFVACWSKFF